MREQAVNRGAVTAVALLASVLYTMDMTIANVALPHIQGSLSAAPDQISWVLTSYLVATTVMTPLSGWLASKIGQKQLLLLSIGGFVLASMICGLATNLSELVAFRLLQGICGAAITPISQSLLLDIYPVEKHGRAMSLWSLGTLMGPVMGPVLGGYLTDFWSWRWCFFINLPIGLLALIGGMIFIPRTHPQKGRPFDFLGFGALALFIACAQLMLDRGSTKDWFSSREIWAEAIGAGLSLWVFVTHSLTAKNPFVDLTLIRDRNFTTCTIFSFFFGAMQFASMSLLPSMMQLVLGYPVFTAGVIASPRGLSAMISMYAVGILVGRVDTRLLMLVGYLFSAAALWQMTHFDLMMTYHGLLSVGLIQGLGMGFLFVPMAALGFANVPGRLRPEASGLFTLTRNMGASVGISVMGSLLVHNTQVMHASLAERMVASDPVVRADLPAAFDLGADLGLRALDLELARQAAMVAYVDGFRLLFILSLASIPAVMLLRMNRSRQGEDQLHMAVE